MNFAVLQTATLAARARCPEFRMLGTTVKAGKFSVVHFPKWGECRSPAPVTVKVGLTMEQAIAALDAMGRV